MEELHQLMLVDVGVSEVACCWTVATDARSSSRHLFVHIPLASGSVVDGGNAAEMAWIVFCFTLVMHV